MKDEAAADNAVLPFRSPPLAFGTQFLRYGALGTGLVYGAWRAHHLRKVEAREKAHLTHKAELAAQKKAAAAAAAAQSGGTATTRLEQSVAGPRYLQLPVPGSLRVAAGVQW